MQMYGLYGTTVPRRQAYKGVHCYSIIILYMPLPGCMRTRGAVQMARTVTGIAFL